MRDATPALTVAFAGPGRAGWRRGRGAAMGEWRGIEKGFGV